jgi:hypothetical protein
VWVIVACVLCEQTSAVLTPRLMNATMPETPLTNNLADWTRALATAKTLYAHQENTLLNLELAEERDNHKEVLLAHNAVLDALFQFLSTQTRLVNESVFDIQQTRLSLQERFYPQLCKYMSRRDDALVRRLHGEAAFEALATQLALRGFSYADYRQSMAEQEAMLELAAMQDARVNQTVREYESVRVEDVDEGDDERLRQPVVKRVRVK